MSWPRKKNSRKKAVTELGAPWRTRTDKDHSFRHADDDIDVMDHLVITTDNGYKAALHQKGTSPFKGKGRGARN